MVRTLVVVALFTSAAAFGQKTPLFQFAEKPGPRPVGLKVVEQYDYSRTYRRLD
jgi:predicted small lipoprotein YifL